MVSIYERLNSEIKKFNSVLSEDKAGVDWLQDESHIKKIVDENG